MIGLIIITHGSLAQGFIEALEQVVGPVDNIKAICLYPEDNKDSIDHHRLSILESINEMDRGKGVILLTDLFGGTPSNLALSTLGINNVEVIAGVNLPMLVRLSQLQKNTSLLEAVVEGQEAGRKYIQAASILLDNKVTNPVTVEKMTKSQKKRI
jgi:PTS system mannose-specific IIA component